ncbi:DNA adenine methylase [Endozoicomonas sp. SESOKO4]|uniref:DNA adenine methylase n=1 Tax=Endozoicomonas sp. SESOKO4 TaxID=2828745 RepID=UPI002147719D|nr:DNA adenine methylase [Endozoicomonas sp. SESOKO4]
MPKNFKPLVPWIGGKRKLAPHILPLFPNHTCYVEPFCGAAALFFLKEESKVEVLNDVNGDLVNLYRVVKHHLEELYKQFKWTLTSRQNYEWLLKTQPETLTDIQRASRFLYLQKLAFGGKVEGQSFGTSATSRSRFNIFSLEQDLADAHFRLANATIENLDWAKTIEKYDRPGTLFYCDPPYWMTEGYGVDFAFENYERMAELAKSIQGRMIISINDHPDIRSVFDGLFIREVDYKYTVGGPQNTSDCVELIYGNWEQEEHLAGQVSQEGFSF